MRQLWKDALFDVLLPHRAVGIDEQHPPARRHPDEPEREVEKQRRDSIRGERQEHNRKQEDDCRQNERELPGLKSLGPSLGVVRVVTHASAFPPSK